MDNQNKEYTGTWIPAFIMEDKKLKPLEKMLYAEIACFVDCFKSNANLAERLDVSERYISSMIKHLSLLGYIKLTEFDGRSRHIKAVSNIKPNKRKLTGETSTTVLPSIEPQFQSAYNHSSTIDNNIEYNIDNKSHVEIQRIYDLYISSFKSNPNMYKLSPLRRQKISKRLKDAGADMLEKAIKNTSKSDFHRGENDRGWKADLDFIIKSYEQVERLANMELVKGKEVVEYTIDWSKL